MRQQAISSNSFWLLCLLPVASATLSCPPSWLLAASSHSFSSSCVQNLQRYRSLFHRLWPMTRNVSFSFSCSIHLRQSGKSPSFPRCLICSRSDTITRLSRHNSRPPEARTSQCLQNFWHRSCHRLAKCRGCPCNRHLLSSENVIDRRCPKSGT